MIYDLKIRRSMDDIYLNRSNNAQYVTRNSMGEDFLLISKHAKHKWRGSWSFRKDLVTSGLQRASCRRRPNEVCSRCIIVN